MSSGLVEYVILTLVVLLLIGQAVILVYCAKRACHVRATPRPRSHVPTTKPPPPAFDATDRLLATRGGGHRPDMHPRPSPQRQPDHGQDQASAKATPMNHMTEESAMELLGTMSEGTDHPHAPLPFTPVASGLVPEE